MTRTNLLATLMVLATSPAIAQNIGTSNLTRPVALELWCGPSMKIEESSRSVHGAFKLLKDGADWAFRRIYTTHGRDTSWRGRMMRLGNGLFVTLPLSNWGLVVGHEWAGHGGRLRELDADILHYRLGLPPFSRASVDYRVADPTPGDLVLIAQGGWESDFLQSEVGFRSLLLHDGRHADYLSFSLARCFNWLAFAGQVHVGDRRQYLDQLAEKYLGLGDPRSHGEFVDDLDDDMRSRSFVNGFDPTLWQALAVYARYLWTGEEGHFLRGVSIRSWAVLPALAQTTSTEGYETHAILYVWRIPALWRMYGCRGHKPDDSNYWGGGIQSQEVRVGGLCLDLAVDFRNGMLDTFLAHAAVAAKYEFMANSLLQLRVGLKSEGFLVGKPVGGGLYAQAGVTVDFP